MQSRIKNMAMMSMVAALLLLNLMVLTRANNPVPVQAQGGGVQRVSTLRVNNFFRAYPRTAITLTNNAVLTPTGTYQRITAASAIGTSGANIVVQPAGTELKLVNVGASAITFTETGTLVSAGNIVLGQNDSATLMSDGTNWTQVAASNN